MNKLTYYILSAILSVLFFSSCSDDEKGSSGGCYPERHQSYQSFIGVLTHTPTCRPMCLDVL